MNCRDMLYIVHSLIYFLNRSFSNCHNYTSTVYMWLCLCIVQYESGTSPRCIDPDIEKADKPGNEATHVAYRIRHSLWAWARRDRKHGYESDHNAKALAAAAPTLHSDQGTEIWTSDARGSMQSEIAEVVQSRGTGGRHDCLPRHGGSRLHS